MLRRNNESGQALVFGVATLGILLIGMAGLGIDMGYLRYQKRLLQSAADSAAIAAASDIPTAFGGVTLAAQNAAAANGYTVASVSLATCPPPAPAAAIGSISLTVNNGPCSGPHTGLYELCRSLPSAGATNIFYEGFGDYERDNYRPRSRHVVERQHHRRRLPLHAGPPVQRHRRRRPRVGGHRSHNLRNR